MHRPGMDITTHTGPTMTDTTDGLAVVTARGLVCRYGDVTAVRGLDLTVHRGELFALLGTNGAGKTTTLETLRGHRRVDEGYVEVLGRDPVAGRRELAARTGTVFQSSGAPGGLTPREMLALWRQLTPDARRHLDPDRVLAQVDLTHRADTRIEHLSGGERRRLDLAVALINDPELLFLDEPTTGMDPEARERTWETVRDLLRCGTTVVLTTHYLEEAEALADRLAIVHRGQLTAAGTLAEVVATAPARIGARLSGEAPPPPPVGDTRRLDATGRLSITTRRLQHDLTALLRWADDHAVQLSELRASEASLTEVFHGIAGTEPTDLDHSQEEASR